MKKSKSKNPTTMCGIVENIRKFNWDTLSCIFILFFFFGGGGAKLSLICLEDIQVEM